MEIIVWVGNNGLCVRYLAGLAQIDAQLEIYKALEFLFFYFLGIYKVRFCQNVERFNSALLLNCRVLTSLN